MYKFENANVTKDFYMPSSNICPIYEFDENFEKNWVMVLCWDNLNIYLEIPGILQTI